MLENFKGTEVQIKIEYLGQNKYHIRVFNDGLLEYQTPAFDYNVAALRNVLCEQWAEETGVAQVTADAIPPAADMRYSKEF